MFFAKNEKYSHVLQVFLANTGWNFFTEDSVTIPANTGFNLKRKFVWTFFLGLKIEKTRFVESTFLGLKMGTQQMENFPVVSALTALCLQGTWWEQDLEAGIWWWWTPQAGWGRWKSAAMWALDGKGSSSSFPGQNGSWRLPQVQPAEAAGSPCIAAFDAKNGERMAPQGSSDVCKVLWLKPGAVMGLKKNSVWCSSQYRLTYSQ